MVRIKVRVEENGAELSDSGVKSGTKGVLGRRFLDKLYTNAFP